MAASYTFEDLSGASASKSSNPYDGLIEDCDDEAAQIQDRYATHRDKRTEQQRKKLVSPDFDAVTIDETLLKLETRTGFVDPRNCLVFWARPPKAVRELIAEVQHRIRTIVPRLWLMPNPNLHMTALEITHSLTEPEITAFVEQLKPVAQRVVDYPYDHRARLVKPRITYDAQAMALSFLPAAGEGLASERSKQDDKYTYHHLRRDLYAACSDAGVKVASRYVVPSAHLTIGRFIFQDEFQTEAGTFDGAKMRALIKVIEETNDWLEKDFWPRDDKPVRAGGEWIVGQEKGLDHRRGTLWYGGGETILLGKGF